MRLRKETIEDRDSTLRLRCRCVSSGAKFDKILTCKRSSKSRAANRFNSELLLEKRRIVLRPKVGVCLYLEDGPSLYELFCNILTFGLIRAGGRFWPSLIFSRDA